MERVRGLDAIRAVCAFWVVMGHFGGPPVTEGMDRTSLAGWFIGGLVNNMWNGPAAVIVFFVISGFCIHFPFATSLRISSLAEYLSRRYLRIGLPLLVAMALAPYLGLELTLFHGFILWSLGAELVYYTLYPFLLLLRRRRLSWRLMIGAAFLAAFALVLTNPAAKNYPAWDVFNWLIGLPCWLIGCELAEVAAGDEKESPRKIWYWRLAVLGASAACSALRFHSSVGFPWTLNFFALLVGVWLLQEIRYYRTNKPSALLEWAGAWSYSVYLVHSLANVLFATMALPNLGYFLNWLMHMAFLLAASYLFFLAVEHPTHLAARWIGRRLAGRSASQTLPKVCQRQQSTFLKGWKFAQALIGGR